MILMLKEWYAMDQIDKMKAVFEEKAEGFLRGKPIWAWWISYTVLIGFLFGLVYFIITVLTESWWLLTIVILAIGILWSTIAYKKQKPNSDLPETKE